MLYTDLHKFTAHAICDTDTVNEDGYQKRYILTCKIENPDAEQEEDMCNWDKIEDVKECGEYNVSEDRYY